VDESLLRKTPIVNLSEEIVSNGLRRAIWLAGLWIVVGASAVHAQVAVPPPPAARIEVFATTSTYLTGVENAKVYYIDGLTQLESYLSQGLPADPNRAAELAKQRAKSLGPGLQQRAMNASEGLTRAKYYGINRTPAVVFDGRTVVYDITDITRARTLYEQPKRDRP